MSNNVYDYKDKVVNYHCSLCGEVTKHRIILNVWGGDELYSEVRFHCQICGHDSVWETCEGGPGDIKGEHAAKRLIERELKINNGCFITTATLLSLGKMDDDCHELMVFREFRDTWLRENHPDEISVYYSIAPKIVNRIDFHPNRKEIYHNIWKHYLCFCMELIEKGKNKQAYELYKQMVEELKANYSV